MSKEAETEKRSRKRWFPLESNPSILNKYVTRLGFDTRRYEFVDVFSTEDWALEMIPTPVAAVLMLYPITPAQEAHRKQEETVTIRSSSSSSSAPSIWHTSQRIGNACGTIGLLHCLANLSPPQIRPIVVTPDSWIDRFLAKCPASLDSDRKADVLEGIPTSEHETDDTGAGTGTGTRDELLALSDELESFHDDATSDESNGTSRGELSDRVDTHFAALVHVDGGLYELDGRKRGPIAHGRTSPNDLLRDACRVVQTFMERDPGEMRFTILALAPVIP